MLEGHAGHMSQPHIVLGDDMSRVNGWRTGAVVAFSAVVAHSDQVHLMTARNSRTSAARFNHAQEQLTKAAVLLLVQLDSSKMAGAALGSWAGSPLQ